MEIGLIKELLIIVALAVFCFYYLSQMFGFKGRVQKVFDEAVDDAFDESKEFQEALQLQRETLDEQQKTNILLQQIKETLERNNVSSN